MDVKNSLASLIVGACFVTRERFTTSMVDLESSSTVRMLTANATQARDSRDKKISMSI
jgi:hypothetical protein